MSDAPSTDPSQPEPADRDTPAAAIDNGGSNGGGATDQANDAEPTTGPTESTSRRAGEESQERLIPRPRRLLAIALGAAGTILVSVFATVLAAWLSPGAGLFADKSQSEAGPTQAPTTTPTTAATGLPFTVAVSSGWDHCGGQWVLPQSPDSFPEPPASRDNAEWKAWAEKLGGARSRRTDVNFTIQGRSGALVVLVSLSVRVVKRAEPLRGTEVIDSACGGGFGAVRWAEAQLDKQPPTITSRDLSEDEAMGGPDVAKEIKPMRFPYTVSISDAEIFQVQGLTTRCDCTWEIEIKWNSEGRSGSYTVNENGRPFRTTGTANVSAACQINSDDRSRQCGPPIVD